MEKRSMESGVSAKRDDLSGDFERDDRQHRHAMKRIRKCYLCGSTENLTRDHIPPLCMFRPPLPANLITVPCCHLCNQSLKLDDEALMIFASGHHAVSKDGMWIWKNKALSSLCRSPKLRANVRKALFEVPVLENQKITTRSAVTLAVSRVERVLIRMTKGLMLHFYPDVSYLDLTYEVEMVLPTQEIVDGLYQTFCYDERGGGTFRFWRGLAAEDRREGVWVYVFFDGMAFYVRHEPKGGEPAALFGAHSGVSSRGSCVGR